MGCSCINKIFDLFISAMGPTQMVLEDQSVWMDDAGFSGALTINVSVKSLTSRGIDTVIPLDVNRRNILDAEDLGSGKSGDCIKDGIYCFTIGPKVDPEGDGHCGVEMSIGRAFLPSAWCAYDALLTNARDDKDYENASRVFVLINAIEAQAIETRVEQAIANYKILTDLLNSLICECCK
jgi:hypothetical protein